MCHTNNITRVEECWERDSKGKRVKYMVTKEGLTLADKHTMQYSDAVLQNCTLDTYVILFTDVTSINVTKIKIYLE